MTDIKTNQPDLLISCNRLTLTDIAGINNMRTIIPDIPEYIKCVSLEESS